MKDIAPWLLTALLWALGARMFENYSIHLKQPSPTKWAYFLWPALILMGFVLAEFWVLRTRWRQRNTRR